MTLRYVVCSVFFSSSIICILIPNRIELSKCETNRTYRNKLTLKHYREDEWIREFKFKKKGFKVVLATIPIVQEKEEKGRSYTNSLQNKIRMIFPKNKFNEY